MITFRASFWLSFRISLLLRDPVATGPVEEKQEGQISEHMGEDWMDEPKHAPRPGDLPLCLSKARSPGRGGIWKSLDYTPRARLRGKGSGDIPHPHPMSEFKKHQ